MFDFKGKLSKECEDFLFNKQRKMEVISIGCVSAVFSIIIVIFAILFHPAILLGLLLFAFMLLVPFLPINRKNFLEHMPNRIWFDFNEGDVFYKSQKGKSSYGIEDIDKILDYGNFYHIKFKKIPDSYYILQKDLIVQGTIEKFEKYFENKIRKVK